MAYGRTDSLTLTTDSSADATGYLSVGPGYLQMIAYTKTDFATGVDFTITDEDAGQTLWTEANVDASAMVYPRAATHSTAGVALLYAASGTAVSDRIFVTGRVKVVVANGGDTKTGDFVAVAGG